MQGCFDTCCTFEKQGNVKQVFSSAELKILVEENKDNRKYTLVAILQEECCVG